MKKSKVVVQACGDYVAFHEMCIGVLYEFGTCDWLDILEEIEDERLDYIIDKIDKEEQLTNEEQKLLDEIVKKYVENYIGDYCDLGIAYGYNIEGEWYISF